MRTRAEGKNLLEKRVAESGLSVTRFALDVLHRDPREVRRWLDLSRAIPNVVMDWLENPTPHPWPEQRWPYMPPDRTA